LYLSGIYEDQYVVVHRCRVFLKRILGKTEQNIGLGDLRVGDLLRRDDDFGFAGPRRASGP
jgi:hypothetical protein